MTEQMLARHSEPIFILSSISSSLIERRNNTVTVTQAHYAYINNMVLQVLSVITGRMMSGVGLEVFGNLDLDGLLRDVFKLIIGA